MKTSTILRDGVNMDDPPSDGLDGSLSCRIIDLPVSRLSDMSITDSGFDVFCSIKNKLSWHESIAVEQLNIVRWLAIG